MSAILPDSVYDDGVRALLRCPPRHTHISIGHLRATIEDPAALRAALTVAYQAGIEDALAIEDAAALLRDPATGAAIGTAFFGLVGEGREPTGGAS